MASLQKLGIERIYYPQEPEKIHYNISINPIKFSNPAQAKKYFTKIINAISKDASKLDGLDNLTLSLNDQKYKESLQSITRELSSKAQEHKEARSKWGENLGGKIAVGTGVVGGIAGLVFGYNQMAELATNVAEHMNNASHLWAPITGLAQTGISFLGTAITTTMGYFGGGTIGAIASSPYIIIKAPLANKGRNYHILEKALFKLETTPKETA